MRTVMCYDVVKNRRRAKLFAKLKGLMRPVQKSVFEGDLDDAGLKRLEQLVLKELDMRTDEVRVFRLCASCARLTRLYGVSIEVGDGEEPIVF